MHSTSFLVKSEQCVKFHVLPVQKMTLLLYTAFHGVLMAGWREKLILVSPLTNVAYRHVSNISTFQLSINQQCKKNHFHWGKFVITKMDQHHVFLMHFLEMIWIHIVQTITHWLKRVTIGVLKGKIHPRPELLLQWFCPSKWIFYQHW